MADPVPYTYKALYLTPEESHDGKKFGLKFAMENKDRWEDISDTTYELQTYDRGLTQLVHENKVYMIQRDFVFVDTKERLYILKCFNSKDDEFVEDTGSEGDSDSEETENKEKPTVTYHEKYDDLDMNKVNAKEPEVEESVEDTAEGETLTEVSETQTTE